MSKPTRKKSLYKKDAWAAFSIYIRTRDTKPTFPERTGQCCTCSRAYPLKQLQAGHFIPGRHGAVLFDERIVHAQCYSCNVGLKGNPRAYDRFMRAKHSDEEMEELDHLAYEQRLYSIPDLIDLRAKYRAKTQELLDNEVA